MTFLELAAFLTGIVYLLGISYSKRWAWFFGIGNAAAYVYISVEYQLFIQAILQGIYVFFGAYGFWAWGIEKHAQVQEWQLKKHLFATCIAAVLALVLGHQVQEWTDQNMAYLDAFISVFALLATYLTAHHILENWYYWIGINLISIVLFSSQELYITAGMFLVNLGMSLWGLYQWKRQLSLEK